MNAFGQGLGRCYFLPIELQLRIASNGTASQRSRAIRSLSLDTSLRTARIGASTLGSPAGPAVSTLAAVKQVTVYDAENGRFLPGRRVRGESDPPSGDVGVNEAFDHLSDTWELFLDAYERSSIDGNGMPLDATVHYEQDYNNAFWDGRRMVFGDGDGDLFEPFTRPIDVAGHELTHGVVEKEAGLIYWGQPGALNESIADVFGSMVKQRVAMEKADQADWLIGEGLFTPAVNGVALRSMSAPGTAYDDPLLGRDDQPAHMDDYVTGLEDNGHVHTNSGIPNHAFYLAALNVGGYAWETAGLVWYSALVSPWVRRTTQFRTFAAVTVHQASVLFPFTDTTEAVRDAWAQVGIEV